MRRILYYLLLIAAVVGSCYVVFFIPAFMPGGADSGTGYNYMETFFKSITNGSIKFGTSASELFIYALALFLIMTAAHLLMMILTFLFVGFNLKRIYKFYRICIWFFIAALILSGFYAYTLYALGEPLDFNSVSYFAYVPLAASILMIILGLIFKATERNSRKRRRR